MLSTSPSPTLARITREEARPDALDAWLTPNAAPPWFGAALWRLWLPREAAGRLLADLDRHAIPVRLAAQIEPRGLMLYLWPSMPNPSLQWLLRSYSAGAVLVEPDTIRGGGVWLCGAALRRLLRPRAAEGSAREVGQTN